MHDTHINIVCESNMRTAPSQDTWLLHMYCLGEHNEDITMRDLATQHTPGWSLLHGRAADAFSCMFVVPSYVILIFSR
jgi:hypothetical protein